MSWKNLINKVGNKIKDLTIQTGLVKKIEYKKIKVDGLELIELLKNASILIFIKFNYLDNHCGYVCIEYNNKEENTINKVVIVSVNGWKIGFIGYEETKDILNYICKHKKIYLEVCNMDDIYEPYTPIEKTNINSVILKCLWFLNINYMNSRIDLNYDNVTPSLLYALIKWTSLESSVDYNYIFGKDTGVVWKLFNYCVSQRFPMTTQILNNDNIKPYANSLRYPVTLFHIINLYNLYLHDVKEDELDKFNQYFMSLTKVDNINSFQNIVNNKDNIFDALYGKESIDILIHILKYLKNIKFDTV